MDNIPTNNPNRPESETQGTTRFYTNPNTLHNTMGGRWNGHNYSGSSTVPPTPYQTTQMQGVGQPTRPVAKAKSSNTPWFITLCSLLLVGCSFFMTYMALQQFDAAVASIPAMAEANRPPVSVEQLPTEVPSEPITPTADPNAPGQTSEGAETPITTGIVMTAEEIYTAGRRSIVAVQTELDPATRFAQNAPQFVTGTGFVIDAERGYILTNYHVVENASQIFVTLEDGSRHHATLLGGEAESSDVALLQIDVPNLLAANLGVFSSLRTGSVIYAIGNPLGDLTHTITSGIVSALSREVELESGQVITMFQIDAAVNSGNSGGPVYSDEGEVVGIVTAKSGLEGVEGIGFAIPIDDALFHVEQWMGQE